MHAMGIIAPFPCCIMRSVVLATSPMIVMLTDVLQRAALVEDMVHRHGATAVAIRRVAHVLRVTETAPVWGDGVELREMATAGKDDVAVWSVDDTAGGEGPRLVVCCYLAPRLPVGFRGALGEGHVELAHHAAAVADDAGRLLEKMADLRDAFGARLALLDVAGIYAILAARLTPKALL